MRERDRKKEIMEGDHNLLKAEHVSHVGEWVISQETVIVDLLQSGMGELQEFNSMSNKGNGNSKTHLLKIGQ